MVDDISRNTAFAGSYVSVVLANVDVESICVGHVLCDVQHPIPVSNRFEAKIVLFDIIYPITKGYPVGISSLLQFSVRHELNYVSLADYVASSQLDRSGCYHET